MQIFYHGHSFVEICTDTLRILIDPFIKGNTMCDVTVQYCIDNKVDAIIVTHGHDDHLGSTVAIAQHHGCQVITSFELAKYLENVCGLTTTSAHGVGGSVEYEGFGVKLFQAWHGGGVADMTHGYTTVACGVIISIDDKTIYHAGDTGLFGDMKMLDELYDIDVAFLPIGDRYTMGVADAIIATRWIQPTTVVPIHYNTRVPIRADVMEFAKQVMMDKSAVPKVLMPGQYVVV